MDANDEDAGHHSSEREAEIARKDREWAAKAQTPAQDQTGIHGTAADTGTGVGSPGPAVGHALRTSGGPRFSGRGVLAVFGILGLLLTIGIMALLSAKVIDGVSGDTDSNASEQPPANTPATDAPAPTDGSDAAVPRGPGQPDGEQIDPGTPAAAARAAECETERATIETAAAAYQILTGTPASSVDEIIAEGLLVPPDNGFSQELSPDGTVVGTGGCATG